MKMPELIGPDTAVIDMDLAVTSWKTDGFPTANASNPAPPKIHALKLELSNVPAIPGKLPPLWPPLIMMSPVPVIVWLACDCTIAQLLLPPVPLAKVRLP